MSVKCKFVCNNVQVHGPNMVSISLHAVIGQQKGDDGKTDYAGENAQWSAATPSGALGMTLTNPKAFNLFEQGKEYYLTIEAADVQAMQDAETEEAQKEDTE